MNLPSDFDLIFAELIRVMAFLFMGLTPVAILALKWRSRQTRKNLVSASSPSDTDRETDLENEEIITDPALLARAEEDARKDPFEYREKLLETYALIERYPTLRGYSESYMEDLINALNDQGIASEYYFQQTMPMGYNSLTRIQGVFELYVFREKEDQAREFIKTWESR